MNLEDELSDILEKLKKPEISLREVRDLYFEAKNKFLVAEEKTEVAGINAVSIFLRVIVINSDFVKNWQSGKISPKNEELDLLEEGCEEVPAVLDYLKENGVKIDDNFFSKTKKGLKELKQKVQQEKEIRRQQQNQSSTPPTSKPSNNQQINQLQNQLNQLSQQIQSLLNNQNKNPADNSNNGQFQQIQEQLNSLQSQIQSLEKQPNNSNSPVSQTDKQELTKLKNQIQQLQKDLQSKPEGRKPTINSQQPDNKFNWLYVVIPGGILLVVAGIAIAYLVGKKNKKE